MGLGISVSFILSSHSRIVLALPGTCCPPLVERLASITALPNYF
jgi:hypothetical protein